MISSGVKYNQSWISSNQFVCQENGQLKDMLNRTANSKTLECVHYNKCQGESRFDIVGPLRNSYKGIVEANYDYGQSNYVNPYTVKCYLQTDDKGK